MDDNRKSGVSAPIGATGPLTSSVRLRARAPSLVAERATTAEPARTRVTRDFQPAEPQFVVPGLVLLAAASIFEGYQWLHLIPGGSLRPSGLFFAVAVLPAAYGLVRYRSTARRALRRVVLSCSAAIPLLALVAVIVPPTSWTRILGVVSLVLAASALILAVASEHVDHSSSYQR